MIDAFIEYAKRFVGVPYYWGGEHPIRGFDCSGFVQECLASIGMDPQGDQTAQALHDFFKPISVSSIPKTGSLLFFGKNANSITHVAIALNEKQMIEAGGGNKETVTVEKAIAQRAFVRIRPISARRDLVGVINLKI